MSLAPVQYAHREMLALLETLSDAERLVLPYCYDLWLRPEQRVPTHDWRSCGFISGRGWGKSMAIAIEINRRVEAGEARHVALMAPTETRAEEVQIKFLTELPPVGAAKPWFRPKRHLGGVLWPNGVRAVVFTPEAPDRPRSENIEVSWCCELVDWQHTTRVEAWNNIATATRVGRSQILWDTTSKGKNDVILAREAEHARDPRAYPIQRGTTFDNPFLARKYLASVCQQYVVGSRRYEEEILGKVFAEAGGALWQQAWIDKHRTHTPPTNPELTLLSVDPALSDRHDADETGIIVGARTPDGHVHTLEDLTGRYKPEVWGGMVIDQCLRRGAAGIVAERSHGDYAQSTLRSQATTRGLTLHVLEKGKTFPRYTPGRLYLREVVSTRSKSSRAGGPAGETEAGRVHIVGTLPALELELTTFEPGASQSPNRLDAFVHLVTELRGLLDERANMPAIDAVDAARASAELRKRLMYIGRDRRVGI